VGATEEPASNFHSMSNNFALAMFADWRDRLNRALEAVEYMAISSRYDLETFVVVISTNFALCHFAPPQPGRCLAPKIIRAVGVGFMILRLLWKAGTRLGK